MVGPLTGASRQNAMTRLSFLVAAVALSCHAMVAAQTTRQERQVSGFDKIASRASGDVVITQGDKEGLVVEAEPRLLPHILADVKGGVLDLRFAPGSHSSRHPVRFHVTLKVLRRLQADGSGNIVAERLDTPSLDVELNGSGDLRIGKLATPRLDVKLAGSANVEVGGGHATRQTVDISGAGNYAAAALASEEAKVSIGGSGDVTVMASKRLVADISGAGNIGYVGDPQVASSVSGAGTVRKRRPG